MSQITSFPKDLPILNQALRQIDSLQSAVNILQTPTTPMIPYSPVITALVGAFTTVSTSGRYATVDNNFIFCQVLVNIITVGTGTYPIVSLPLASNGKPYILSGVEIATTGMSVTGHVGYAGNGLFLIRKYDGSNPSASGYKFALSGLYELS